MTGSGDRKDGAPSHIHIEKDRPGGLKWLPWLLLLLAILALLFALSRCDRKEASTPSLNAGRESAAASGQPQIVAQTPGARSAAALAGVSSLGTYLAGAEPTPRTFTFEKLNFDTAKSDIRPADAAEVDEVATTLAKYRSAKIRIAGFADARGPETANKALGAARAESVKKALIAKGIDAGRIETISGGEDEPVANNSTPGGRFENRRTELVVLTR